MTELQKPDALLSKLLPPLKADGGGVAIGPDGSLYPCEHCLPESRFGDVWHGVTDEAVKLAYTRAGRTREKCRTCPFLPDCTSFAACPVEDPHCREGRMILTLSALRRLADGRAGAAEDEDPDC